MAFWSATEPDGSATDKGSIDPTGTLTVNTVTGDIVVTATAANEGGTTTHKSVSLNVPAVTVTSAQLRVLQGTPAGFLVSLSNNDSKQANSATVQAAVPDGWTVQPASASASIPAGKTVNTTFTATPPADATGTQTLTLSAQGDWGNSARQVQATVGTPVILVGKIDVSTAEFALTPNQYEKYPTQFPNDVDFTDGTSRPATDWSYIQPGPDAAWAGNTGHTFTFRFDLPQAPSTDLSFTAWLIDTHQAGPPTATLGLNGAAVQTLFLPAGGREGRRKRPRHREHRPLLAGLRRLRSNQQHVMNGSPSRAG